MPPGWLVTPSQSQPGSFYFYETATGRSQWELPRGFSAPQGAVRASHLLVKHRDSRNPFSSRDKEHRLRRSKEEAIQILREHRDQIVRNGLASFGDMAARHSDCSSYKNRGDLGSFERGKMQKAFEDASYALQVGEMSDIVDTDSGVHIILRTQ